MLYDKAGESWIIKAALPGNRQCGFLRLKGEGVLKSRLNLKPGQKGTKALVEKYGDDLVCVRYRYDEATRIRIKTVEIIVEKKELPPTVLRIKDDTLVPVQIAYGETELGKMARKTGGKWVKEKKLWYIRYGDIKGTELEKHILKDALIKNRAE